MQMNNNWFTLTLTRHQHILLLATMLTYHHPLNLDHISIEQIVLQY